MRCINIVHHIKITKGDYILKEIKIAIPGKPMGKQRPKFSTQGKFVNARTPQETVNYENLVKILYRESYDGMSFEQDEPLELIVNAYFLPPANTSKKKLALMYDNKIRPTKKPDFDNIAKIIGDALNAVAYPDDKQVVEASIHKFYGTEPRVEITVRSILESEETNNG